jgi:uncharacterized protein (DUF433 family)
MLGIIVNNGAAVKKAKTKTKEKQTRLIGRFIVADPSICHGKPTFRGTRILVADILEQVAAGTDWDSIVEEWRGSIPKDAIAEAVRMASQAFLDHSGQYAAPEYVLERVPA